MKRMTKFKSVLFVMLWLAFYGMITKEVGLNVNAQEPPSTSELRVYLPIIANQDSNASLLLQPEATTETMIDVNASALPNPTLGIWLNAAELAQLPITGTAWNWLKAKADQAAGTPSLSDQDSLVNTSILAKALVYARTGQMQYRTDVVAALRVITFNNTEAGGRTLALGRELAAYVVAADLIDLQGYDAALNTQFKNKLRELLTKPLDGLTLVSTHELRPNNWGTHAGASRAAVALYLGDQTELARTALVFRGYLGDTTAYNSFNFGSDLSWQANARIPVGVNPLGATKEGRSIDGALPEEMRRGGSFEWPPKYTNYVWEGLQGALVQAYLLDRAGYPVWQWQDRALLRAVQFLYGLGWAPEGDDKWQVWLINDAYGTTYPAEAQAAPGKNMGWTSWTHGTTVAPPTNQPPNVNAGPDLSGTLPDSILLTGTVNDDRWPKPPATTTVAWSVISGPGTVTFNNANALTTNASFTVAGAYVLQLSANDGQLSSTDTVAIIVNAPSPTNSAPSVNAGADAVLTLPAGATLDGTVSDDGLPSNQLNVSWSMVSGPGSVTFGNPAAVDTTATFGAAGVYTLQLAANDGALSSSDTVAIIVNAPSPTNSAPSVNAGADAVLTLPAGATLDGTVSDDGLPSNQLNVSWSMVSGPGSVTFGNPAAVDTTATFGAAGVYTLQLAANDGQLSSSDAVVITVNPASSTVTKVQVRVANKTDDAEERSGRKADLTSSDLELVEDSGKQIVGLRFRNLTIPKGAIISNVYLQFQTDAASSGATNLLVQGEASDNAAQFLATVNNLAARPRTAAAVGWIPVAWPKVGAAGAEQRTPNLAPVLQEIVNRPGWQSGNTVVLLITGSGKRTAESYDGKSAAAPLLYIEYQ